MATMAAVAPAQTGAAAAGEVAAPPAAHRHHHHHHGHHHHPHQKKISVESSNALEHFPALESQLLGKAKRVVVLLDYDGTLTPIVNDPTQALLPSRTRDILVELAERCVVGIVSGRSLPKVQGFVQVPSLFYAGSHGFDIWGPTLEDSMRYQVAADQLPKLAALRDRLTERLSSVKGAAVEDNVFSVSVHYRNCDPGDVQEVYETVETLRSEYPSLRLGHGKCVFELRPDIMWDKGKAMVWLLQALGLRGGGGGGGRETAEADARQAAAEAEAEGGGEGEVCTIYIGDDVTDEDAFSALVEEGGRIGEGIGIVVTDEDKVTGAKYSLRNPDEVAAFLMRLVQSRGDDFAGGNRAFFSAGKFNTSVSLGEQGCVVDIPVTKGVGGGGGEEGAVPPVTPTSTLPPPPGVGEGEGRK